MQAVDLAALRSLSEAEEKEDTSGNAAFKIKAWKSHGRVDFKKHFKSFAGQILQV